MWFQGVVLLLYASAYEAIVRGLKRRMFWAWVMGLRLSTLIFPFGVLGLWGLLAAGFRREFGMGVTPSAVVATLVLVLQFPGTFVNAKTITIPQTGVTFEAPDGFTPRYAELFAQGWRPRGPGTLEAMTASPARNGTIRLSLVAGVENGYRSALSRNNMAEIPEQEIHSRQPQRDASFIGLLLSSSRLVGAIVWMAVLPMAYSPSEAVVTKLSCTDKTNLLQTMDFSEIRRVQDIPTSVLSKFPENAKDLANPGERFQSTDVSGEESLPKRRLIWGVVTHDYCVIHYERGGFTRFYRLVLFRRAGHDARFLWGVDLQFPLKNFAEWRELLKVDTLDDSQPFYW